MKKTYSLFIGIDPGVKTGFALYNKEIGRLTQLLSWRIHEAMDMVKQYRKQYGDKLFVRVEDPRKAFTWNKDPKRLEGIGSVKAHAKIWEDFLTDLGIDHEMVKPNRKITKWTAKVFKQVTGYTGSTDEHARDAAMLVYGR